jgi:hypothetical protein
VAAIYGSAGYSWVFVYIAACWIAVALTIGLFGPATGDVALEDLQAAVTTGASASDSARATADGA